MHLVVYRTEMKRHNSLLSEEPPSSPDSMTSESSSELYENLAAICTPVPNPAEESESFEYEFNYPPSPVSPPPPCPEPIYQPVPESRKSQDHFISAVQNGDHDELRQILATQRIQINGFTIDGQTALTQSCLNGNLEVVKLLVSHGASPQLTNRDGFSPLHIAFWCGKMDVIRYLLDIAR